MVCIHKIYLFVITITEFFVVVEAFVIFCLMREIIKLEVLFKSFRMWQDL